ncbi:MAG: alanine dehydrogenase [Myxococcota bacterium]
MRIGVPKETKVLEFRVGMVPDGVAALSRAGHEVWIEAGAGAGSGFADAEYEARGAKIVDREAAWSAELVVKVKEPQPDEVPLMQRGQVLFTYLHLAPNPELTHALLAADVIGVAYETIRSPDGTFPVLAPMSEVAGRLAAQIGVTLLQKDRGGKGILVGGVPGVLRGRVSVIGGGIVGINAARVAHALGAEVDVLDIDLQRLTYLYDIFRGELNTLYANTANIERSVVTSDLVIGAVYIAGRRAPTIVTEAMIEAMQPGSVVADVAVDQGGCVETIRPTTHADPTYLVHDVIHYGVANMPGAVPRTSTQALTNTTLPYIERIAGAGIDAALAAEPALALGTNVYRGKLVHPGVADATELPLTPLKELVPGTFEAPAS